MIKRVPDERIQKLSYAKFEEEFGFRPKNKTEQMLFALKGRQPNPMLLAAVERLEELKAKAKQEPKEA